MTDTRAPYFTIRETPEPTIAYPGSDLQLLVEALDDLQELAPEAYPLKLARIHTDLAEALRDNKNASLILSELLRKR